MLGKHVRERKSEVLAGFERMQKKPELGAVLAVKTGVKMSTEEDEKRSEAGTPKAPQSAVRSAVKNAFLRYRSVGQDYGSSQMNGDFWTSCAVRSSCRGGPSFMRCSPEARRNRRGSRGGFTVVEILVVLVIIAIAAMMVIPMMGSAGSMQIRSAANVIAADLEYAKSMAIGRQKIYTVIFNTATESYQIEDPNGVIGHPIKKGFNYVVDFSSDSRVDEVDIVSADFDTTSEIQFDYLGCPYNGDSTALNSGVVTLQAGQATATITVEPVTGFISISE